MIIYVIPVNISHPSVILSRVKTRLKKDFPNAQIYSPNQADGLSHSECIKIADAVIFSVGNSSDVAHYYSFCDSAKRDYSKVKALNKHTLIAYPVKSMDNKINYYTYKFEMGLVKFGSYATLTLKKTKKKKKKKDVSELNAVIVPIQRPIQLELDFYGKDKRLLY